MEQNLVIGLDCGTDSMRALVVDVATGDELASAAAHYPRWSKGLHRDSEKKQFSQHPLDYIESVKNCIIGATSSLTPRQKGIIRGIGIAATGSTPCAVDQHGIPLALHDEFSENPNAMFLLWKDHRSEEEAQRITEIAREWGGTDFTRFSGGSCSPEWFWPKLLHVLRHDTKVRNAAFSWVELCDWLPAMLTGNSNPLRLKRSRGAAGHKALWHQSWDGLPSEEFLTRVDPLLAGWRNRLFIETFAATQAAGTLCPRWAEELGLKQGIIVSVGTMDGHVAGLNVPVTEKSLVKTIGTSSVDVLVVKPERIKGRAIPGLCGQVDGSVIPGMITLELGQAAFGDLVAWFERILSWPEHSNSRDFHKLFAEEASKSTISGHDLVIVGWLNGRRSPFGDLSLRGSMSGITMATSAVDIYRALIESLAFGTKDIVEHLKTEEFAVEEVILLGEVAHKNPFLVQTLSDVLNIPVKTVRSKRVCAAGAAILGAISAGFYPSISEAHVAMGKGFADIYQPREAQHYVYNQLYNRYSLLCSSFPDSNTIVPGGIGH